MAGDAAGPSTAGGLPCEWDLPRLGWRGGCSGLTASWELCSIPVMAEQIPRYPQKHAQHGGVTSSGPAGQLVDPVCSLPSYFLLGEEAPAQLQRTRTNCGAWHVPRRSPEL